MARSSERVQELLAEKLAQQDADREVIGGIIDRYTQLPPKEDEDYDISGIPEAEEGVIAPLLSPFAPLKAKQIKAPESTYGEQFYRFTGGFDGDAVTTERPRTSYTPGEYDYKAGEPPIITGISDLLKFGDRALFGTPEEKAEVKKQTQEFIKGLPQILPDLMKGTIKSAQNIEAGGITTKDEDTGQITRPTEFLYNMGSTLAGIGAGTSRSIARTAGDDGQVLGIMGGARMKSGPDKIAELRKFEEQAVAEGRKRGEDFRPFYAELWANQLEKGDNLRVYRSMIDDQPRIEIDTSNVNIQQENIEKFKNLLKTGYAEASTKPQLKRKATLQEVLSFPELFEEYPFLKDMDISYDSKIDSAAVYRSTIDDDGNVINEIALGPSVLRSIEKIQELEERYIEIANSPTMGEYREKALKETQNNIEYLKDQDVLASVLHEIQHAVQDYEKLEGGSNIRTALSPEDQNIISDRILTPKREFVDEVDTLLKNHMQSRFQGLADPRRRHGINLDELTIGQIGNATQTFRNIGEKIKKRKEQGWLLKNENDEEVEYSTPQIFEDFLQEEWENFSEADRSLLNAFISKASPKGRERLDSILNDMNEETLEVRRDYSNDGFARLGLDTDDWEKVYDEMTDFLETVESDALDTAEHYRKEIDKANRIIKYGAEMYTRTPGEVEARLVETLFTGIPTGVRRIPTPKIPQRKRKSRESSEGFIDALFSFDDKTPDFIEGSSDQITPRRPFTQLVDPDVNEIRAERRFMYPEELLDVDPNEMIFPRQSRPEVPTSRSKTKRALYGPPKGLADGGPVGDRVTELLDATFRK